MRIFTKRNIGGIMCSECETVNDYDTNYCVSCGHKLKTISKDSGNYRTYCVICGEQVKKNDEFCGNCGYEIFKTIEKVRICPICGEWMNIERYCQNCGHDKYSIKGIGITDKICPNCNKEHRISYNYCMECGTKLIWK